MTEPRRYRFGDVEIDVAAREVTAAGERVAVEPMVFDVLLHLVRHADRVVTKHELLDEIWGDRFVSESALTSRIKSARQAVGDDGRAQHTIRTLHGVGYRFVAELELLETASAAGAAPTVEAAGPDAELVGTPVDLELRFVEVEPGVNVAAGLSGSGPPLVKAATWMTHVDRDTADNPVWSHWVSALGRRHRYVRYDPRGCGLSDRDLGSTDLTDLDRWVDDLEAVIDACGLERVALLGVSQGGPVAIGYAARHPDRVSHLILFGTYARGMNRRDDPRQADQGALQVDLARIAWDSTSPIFREVFARQFVPGARAEEIEWFNEQLATTTSAENAPRLEGAFHDLDVSALARAVRVPTLVMHSRGDEAVPFEEGRRLAALVPGARFLPLESRNHVLLARDDAFGRFVAEIDAFTGAR